jgi:DNA-binding MarR family transcriptional regulator
MDCPDAIRLGMALTPRKAGLAFSELFGSVFLRFHRRGPKRTPWTPQGWAVLQHLQMAGPLTVTEAARHMDRAQSVMSGIIDGLERKGLLGRMRDARDRRRTLVWLTDEGRAAMAVEQRVLCLDRLEQAFAKLDGRARGELLAGLRALLASTGEPSRSDVPRRSRNRTQPEKRRSP